MSSVDAAAGEMGGGGVRVGGNATGFPIGCRCGRFDCLDWRGDSERLGFLDAFCLVGLLIFRALLLFQLGIVRSPLLRSQQAQPRCRNLVQQFL